MDKQMKQVQEEYQQRVMTKMPKPKLARNLLRAYLVGGLICMVGQGIGDALIALGMAKDVAAAATSILLVFIGATLTGIGIYDKIGKFAGAGSIVPITGFANSIVSPAMEFKREGLIMGVGSKLFTLAGPVLVNGISVSVLIGIIYYFVTLGR